jgi:hypothetical protein
VEVGGCVVYEGLLGLLVVRARDLWKRVYTQSQMDFATGRNESNNTLQGLKVRKITLISLNKEQ